MTDKENSKILSICAVNFIWVDMKTGKPKFHPEELMNFLSSIDSQFSSTGLDYFNERVKHLRKEIKKSAMIS